MINKKYSLKICGGAWVQHPLQNSGGDATPPTPHTSAPLHIAIDIHIRFTVILTLPSLNVYCHHPARAESFGNERMVFYPFVFGSRGLLTYNDSRNVEL